MKKTLITFIPLLALLGSNPVLAQGTTVTSGAVSPEKPNILFIAVDDYNDWVESLGVNPDVMTPNIDRLMTRGLTFTNAYCQFPHCAPSRASVMSGLYPPDINVTSGNGDERSTDNVIQKTQDAGGQVLDAWFREHGYFTMVRGKIYHARSSSSRGTVPTDQADVDGGWVNGWGGGIPEEHELPAPEHRENVGPIFRWGPYPDGDERNQDENVDDYQSADFAIEQIQAHETREKPFFLAVGLGMPHTPWHAGQQWYAKYDPATLTLPPYDPADLEDLSRAGLHILGYRSEDRWAGDNHTEWAIEHNYWRGIVQGYLACISFMDAQVGRLLDALEASPQAENTIIVLWSDHGFHMGEKNYFGKLTPYRRSARVPLVFAGSGIPQGERCDLPVELIDLFPTLTDLAGIPGMPIAQGDSLVPLIRDPQTNEWDHPAYTYTGKNDNQAISTRDFRLLSFNDGDSFELYRADDFYETTNLANDPDYADELEELKTLLRQPEALLNQ